MLIIANTLILQNIHDIIAENKGNSQYKEVNMKEKVLETIKKYNLIKSGDRIVIGVSGRTRFNLLT